MPQKPAPRRPNKPGPNKPGRKPPFGKGRPPARAPQRKAAPPRRPAPVAKSGESDEGDDDSESSRLGERLQKVLAAAGVASRRECEELITEGRVEVDGKVVSELGARVDRSSQEIRVDGEPLPRPKLVYYAINKPTGVVTTARDPSGRPRVIDLLPPDAGRLFTVGRLDLASEGLILATNDGELANQLTHPKHGVEKTYEVQVAGQMEPDVLSQIRRGVHLSEGYAHAVHAWIKAKLKRSTLLEMVLDEGRNREVRRLLARVGHKVQRLTRIAVGPIRLGELPRGAVRKLTPEEVRKLREAAAAGPKPARDVPPAARSASGSARPPRPASTRPASARPAGARSVVSKRPPTKKPAFRKPPVTSAPPAADDEQTFQRKIVGDDGSGLVGPRPGRPVAGKPAGKTSGRAGGTGRGKPVGGRPAGGKPVGGRAVGGGKPDFRKTKGTKLTGRKPVKRRRPERPQRGGNTP